MTAWSFLDLDRALRASWAADTASPDDVDDWHPDNPSWGHCDVTALVVQDLLGGEMVMAEVYVADGSQRGYHWWNKLASGLELDLTLEQFRRGETLRNVQIKQRPPGPLPRRWDEYLLLRERVSAHLGPLPPPY